uniref:Uncharacterized protein n=1 Tax=Heterorhabditis bacteriophora TaxID=37862 RepID=A0A1I7WKF5_HETBA
MSYLEEAIHMNISSITVKLNGIVKTCNNEINN